MCGVVLAAAETDGAAEVAPNRDERMRWWREARFGLFIHWGLYAIPAGEFEGRKIDSGVGNGLGEWIMYNAKIPVDGYAAFARQFNPTAFDARAWVAMAKQAGMKYIVITSKHHDGFALFQSAASDFNVVSASPFKRDIIAELATACRESGIRLGFYYSQAQDWHQPGGAVVGEDWNYDTANPASGRWDPKQNGDFDDYLSRVALPQVRELLTHYGQVDILWWDTPIGMTDARAARFAKLLTLQPRIITNNRLRNPHRKNAFSGDTETPEQYVPATGMPGTDFEVCMTMNDSWGYKARDKNWKPARELIQQLVDVASKGGNLLLNVGPDASGRFPPEAVQRLQAIGRWTSTNGEAIYGTSAAPGRRPVWGRVTTKPAGKDTAVYLHVFDWRPGKSIRLGLANPVRSVSLLGDSTRVLPTSSQAGGIIVQLAGAMPDPSCSVIKLVVAGKPVSTDPLPSQDSSGAVNLSATAADINNVGYAVQAKLAVADGIPVIDSWSEPKVEIRWEFQVTSPSAFDVVAEVSAVDDTRFTLKLDDLELRVALRGGGKEFRSVKLGRFARTAQGAHVLGLIPDAAGWRAIRLRNVRLIPAE